MAPNKKDEVASQSQSLLILVLDCSPLAWGDRDFKRTVQDKKRGPGKRSIGPVILQEVLEAVQAFGSAFCSIERDAGLVVIAVADNESSVVYPRKDVLAEWLNHPENYVPDIRRMRTDLITGVRELVARASRKAQIRSNASSRQAAMASAFSSALCLINRFLVAARTGGVSALQNEHFLNRSEDDGVLALIGGNNKSKKSSNKQPRAWSPRIMLIQASDDRSRDYNAFMNCAFAALKHQIVVDGCFLSAGGGKSSSAFLEQVCDLTGGVYLPPHGAASVDGALTEVLFSVFLPPLSFRPSLNLPTLNKVEFRARCFETAEIVDMASVCNQCLSIFSKEPKGTCPTCGAKTLVDAKKQKT